VVCHEYVLDLRRTELLHTVERELRLHDPVLWLPREQEIALPAPESVDRAQLITE
jgi:hypothetical protein